LAGLVVILFVAGCHSAKTPVPLAYTDKEAFLDMAQNEANAADQMSMWLNFIQIFLLILIVVATFAGTIAAAADLLSKNKRAILAGIPALSAGLLAVVNPRVDWHRRKEIELNAIVCAVKWEGLSLARANAKYWSIRREMEMSWQKSKRAEIDSGALVEVNVPVLPTERFADGGAED